VFPDVIEVPISNSHEFIVIACDGIWDVISNKEAVEFCRKGLSQGKPPEQVSIF
jgi:protein phosphatase 2C family protein 2/3